MTYQSHRIRVEEKKVVRKLITTLVVIFSVFMILVFAGLPALAKIIVFFSSFQKDSGSKDITDTSILFPPSLNPLFEATFSARISVSGYGEKNATVKIFVNNKEQAKAQTDKDGNFKALNIKLDEGSNNITAQNLLNDKSSTTSSPLSVVYKKTPPKLDIISPKDGDKFDSDHENITINGETDPGVKIEVNDRLAIVDQQGKFSFPVRLNSGDNGFKIIATDIAGNIVESELNVSFNP